MPDLSLVRFNADIAKFAKQLELDQKTIVQTLTLNIFTAIVEGNPVDTGRSRAGWAISIGSPDVPTPPPGNYGPPPAPDLSAIDGKQIVWILNNVEYIEALEEGHSQAQAPNGMVRLAIARAEADINAEII